MTQLSRTTSRAALALSLGLALGAPLACGPDAQAATPAPVAQPDAEAASSGEGRTDEQDSARVELLELAFRGASKFPLDPHIKNRSRAQQRVTDALIELGETERALDLADDIRNWRRGNVLAAAALARLERGEQDGVRPLLLEAEQIVRQMAVDADSQAWRRDEIRVLLARSYRALGEPERAAPFEADLEDIQAGKLASALAEALPDAEFDARVAALDAIVQTGGLDPTLGALDAFVALYDRNFDDADRRALLAGRVRDAFGQAKLPVGVRVDAFVDLADAALAHDASDEALSFIQQATKLVRENSWLPEHQIQLTAKLAGLLQRAGADDDARHERDVALAMYDTARDRIVNIYRAETLLPLAEVSHALGDAEQAQALYARATEEAIENPNSRPRCDDLVAVCVSLATHDAAPNSALRARIEQLIDALGAPW